ncbi:AMP-binding protein [Aldersonia sp. NBC_00410]|uniref:(2,3-dihydroxybenzoyl)adenylate synthase n=1 Tax=Aldersonia sp. NBC_00410 TaxID=2975954 RepID=UPI002253234F|nr:AMP-binding protein [Aldersonia sp. NBC_00410]MCX5043511.1 AMP-binding protein [Aldersonia sp. NBC_00410]
MHQESVTATAAATTGRPHRDGFVPFRDDLAAVYREAGYWRGTTLGSLLRDAAAQRPDATALLTADGAHSYRALDDAADEMAAGFADRGIAPGDRVVVQLPNRPEFAVALFGLLRAGAIPVLCLPAHRAAEIGHLAEVAEAIGYVIADSHAGFDYRELAQTVRDRVPTLEHVFVVGDPGPFTALSEVPRPARALADPDPSDIAVLLVSGGTTGLPKLIARTHDDYAYNARASAEVCALTAEDVYLATLPAAHNFPLACPGILGTITVGGAIAFTDDPSPESAFAAIERHRVTVTAVVPPLAQLWCAATEWEDADLSSLRLLQVGGARLADSNAAEVTPALGARLQQVFGMAEGLLNYTRLDDPDELVLRTQGRPLSTHDEIRIVDEGGRDVAAGAEGELLTRGPYTIRGYYRAPAHNERAITADGFYRSGDLVRRLPSGHLVVSGRVKDVINRGGENISCDELEDHLLAHPAVRHAAAVGIPDESLGERVCAAMVPAADTLPTLAELKAFLLDRGLATYKLPDLIAQLDTLPVTAVGKIDKRTLSKQIAP